MLCYLKRGDGAGRHGHEAAEELWVADEERDEEGARVGGRDDDHFTAGLRASRQDGLDQVTQEGGPVPHPGATSLSSP